MPTPQTSKPRAKSSWIMRSAGVVLFGLTLIFVAEVISVAPSHASLPVVDVTVVGQMVQQALQMAKQLATMAQQVALLKNQIQSMTGHYGMGKLGGELNKWGNTTWQDVGAMAEKGVNLGDSDAIRVFKEAHQRYQRNNPPLPANLVPQNQRTQTMYSRNYQDAINGMGIGEQTFNSLPGHLRDLQTYKTRIEQTQNLKGSMDLNTAVVVKNAQLSAEILRLNALQFHMQANTQNNQTSGQAAQAEFFGE